MNNIEIGVKIEDNMAEVTRQVRVYLPSKEVCLLGSSLSPPAPTPSHRLRESRNQNQDVCFANVIKNAIRLPPTLLMNMLYSGTPHF